MSAPSTDASDWFAFGQSERGAGSAPELGLDTLPAHVAVYRRGYYLADRLSATAREALSHPFDDDAWHAYQVASELAAGSLRAPSTTP